MVTNLWQTGSPNASSPGFSWAFDLNGISEMYQSYEETNLWYLLVYGLELFLDLVLFTQITKFTKNEMVSTGANPGSTPSEG